MGCGNIKTKLFKDKPRSNSFGLEDPESLQYTSPATVIIKDKDHRTGKTVQYEEITYNLKRPELSTS